MVTNVGKSQKIKRSGESGQTREGIGAVAVRLLRCHAFTDATNTSVVLCFPGGGRFRVVVVVDGEQEVEERGGEGR